MVPTISIFMLISKWFLLQHEKSHPRLIAHKAPMFVIIQQFFKLVSTRSLTRFHCCWNTCSIQCSQNQNDQHKMELSSCQDPLWAFCLNLILSSLHFMISPPQSPHTHTHTISPLHDLPYDLPSVIYLPWSSSQELPSTISFSRSLVFEIAYTATAWYYEHCLQQKFCHHAEPLSTVTVITQSWFWMIIYHHHSMSSIACL